MSDPATWAYIATAASAATGVYAATQKPNIPQPAQQAEAKSPVADAMGKKRDAGPNGPRGFGDTSSLLTAGYGGGIAKNTLLGQ